MCIFCKEGKNRSVYTRSLNRQIRAIAEEEAAGYYDGKKTLEDVSAVIQSRVQILVQENL